MTNIGHNSDIVVYNDVRKKIADAREEHKGHEFDYTSTEGNKAARSYIYGLRRIKAEVEDARKKEKAASLDYGRRVDEQAKTLTADIEAMIAPHMAALDALEQKEKDRIAAIEKRIEQINIDAQAISRNWDALPVEKMEEFRNTMLTTTRGADVWQEFTTRAVQAIENALSTANQAIERRATRDAEQAELARLRKEQKEREDREAAERAEREAQEKKERAEREAREKAERENTARLKALDDLISAANQAAYKVALNWQTMPLNEMEAIELRFMKASRSEDVWQERLEAAIAALDTGLIGVTNAIAMRKKHDAEQAELQASRDRELAAIEQAAQAEREATMARERAERETREANERAEQAAQKERDRIAREQREEEERREHEAREREENEKHCQAVRDIAIEDFVQHGYEKLLARRIVETIEAGNISNVKIEF